MQIHDSGFAGLDLNGFAPHGEDLSDAREVQVAIECAGGPTHERVEVSQGKVTVRLDAATPADRIAEIVSTLNMSE